MITLADYTYDFSWHLNILDLFLWYLSYCTLKEMVSV